MHLSRGLCQSPVFSHPVVSGQIVERTGQIGFQSSGQCFHVVAKCEVFIVFASVAACKTGTKRTTMVIATPSQCGLGTAWTGHMK